MPVETRELSVTGKEDCGIVDITEMISEEIRNSTIRNGTVTVFCVGSTGAISTMEFESNLSKDVSEILEKLIPLDRPYHHHKTWQMDLIHNTPCLVGEIFEDDGVQELSRSCRLD